MSELALKLIRENIEKHERGEDASVLDLGNCGLTRLPVLLGECIWIKELILSSEWSEFDWEEEKWRAQKSQNKNKPNKLQSLEGIRDLSALTKLIASGQYKYNKKMPFSDLSPLQDMIHLRDLYISYTRVSNLSPLRGLTNLQILNASYTQASNLLPLQDLKNLQKLYVASTHVVSLLPLQSLRGLQQLYVSDTQVFNLDPLQELTELRLLHIYSTQVSDLSPLRGLVNLQKIHLSSTFVSDLSPLKGLANLQRLYIRNTRVSDLSPIVELIRRDGYVRFEGCPLKHPPIEIAKRGDAAILRYFDELNRQASTRLYEAKCLIIGEGGAGKTSLARKLLSEANALPAEADTTKGIEVQPLDLKLADGTDFRLHLWDFGGQEIYHATHQFFLTKRSLYVLVDDTRKDEKTVNDPVFNYWFQVAELFGGGSPLLIVQNEKGDRSKQLDLPGMQGRFGFVKESRAANLLTCRGLAGVREAIEYHLRQMPHVGEVLPKSWADIRRALDDLRQTRDHLSQDEYFALCRDHDIPERDRALFLSDYLHDLGAFLHFKDETYPLLRKMVILNNQWVTAAVYRVLDDEPVKALFGRFTRADLARIWAEAGYADYHDELLALMQKFELCYQLPDEAVATWLAPQLLPVVQPTALAWDAGQNLQLRYEYDFMPRGLLSRFIVRMHRYVRDPDLAWRSGVVLERQGAVGLVTETWGSREIVVRVRGLRAKELLTLIAEDFERMHARFEGLRYKTLIPCNCRVCGASEKPHFYDFENLRNRQERGKETIECQVSFENVPVAGLLEEIFVSKNALVDRKSVEALMAQDATEEVLTLIEAVFPDVTMHRAQLTFAKDSFHKNLASEKELLQVRQKVNAAILDWLKAESQ